MLNIIPITNNAFPNEDFDADLAHNQVVWREL